MNITSPQIETGPTREYYVSRLGEYWPDFVRAMDETAGDDGWSLIWKMGHDRTNDASFIKMCQLYEDSYTHHFEQNPQLLEEIATYDEVYDREVSDIESGGDYTRLLHEKFIHIQDIAIRRLIGERGLAFTGETNRYLQIRSDSEDSLGARLSPFWVRFISPDAISETNPLVPEGSKWLPDSIEAFYQLNRRLVIRQDVPLAEITNSLRSKLGEAVRVEAVTVSPTE